MTGNSQLIRAERRIEELEAREVEHIRKIRHLETALAAEASLRMDETRARAEQVTRQARERSWGNNR